MPTTPDHPGSDRLPRLVPGTGLVSFPPAEKWDDWEEYDAKAWPDRVKRRYRLVPTTCFNCEAGCGLLAYVDKDSGKVRRFEGNPEHPGSRGRNCAKGPATLNQMYDPERILHPLRRSGPRGSGKWEQVSWEEALGDIASRIRRALQEDRHDEIMYHVGRPGEDGFMERVLRSWGVDGHNSHTNICSSGARTGYAMWMGYDRPSADFANARFILLLSAQLESGHYFNPHAQRIIEARQAGGKVATIDPRLSNTAAMSDYWLSPWPGTEAAMLLAIAARLLEWDAVDHDYVRRWVNWETSLAALAPERPRTYESFVELLAETYAPYTIEYAAEETGVDAWRIEAVARGIADAGSRFASHTWRAAGSGNLGGWQVARCLFFLHVLTGSVGTEGGTSPSAWDKFKPEHWNTPPPANRWNELIWPGEFPLSHYEMSYLLPHFLKEGRGRIEVYFTRVYNPVWTNPDGFSWMEALTDEDRVGLHVALSPTWSESAWFADYVLPMGVGAERHDTHSYETHAARWLGFRQPVLRVAGERAGRQYERTYEANPGEVWEENEFWIDLSWRIDPDGSLGIRQWYESPNDPSRPVNLDEYYGWMFDNSVPGLPEHAGREGLTPLEYMRKYGAFEIDRDRYLSERSGGGPRSARRRGRRRAQERLHFPLPPPRMALGDARGLELARSDHPHLSQVPCLLAGPRPRGPRAHPASHLPAPHPDPYPIGQRQVPVRDQPRAPAVDEPGRRRPTRVRHRRPGPDQHRHRLLPHAGLAHRGPATRSGGGLPSHGPLAPGRQDGKRALVIGPGGHRTPRRRVAAAAPLGYRTLPLGRPRQRTHLVAGPGSAPEPGLPRTSRPGVGHARLAPTGPPHPCGTGRPVWGCLRRHREIPPDLPRVDGPHPSRTRTRRPAPPPLARQAADAGSRCLPGLTGPNTRERRGHGDRRNMQVLVALLTRRG